MRRLLVAALMPLVSGCYVYMPIQSPRPGTYVRAALTVEGAVRQSELLGRPTRNFNGRLVSLDDNALRLDVITASTRGQLREIVLRDTLSIPRAQVIQLQTRQLSWARTGVVAAGVGTAVYVIINSLTSGGENIEGDGDTGEGLDRVTIPIFSIRR